MSERRERVVWVTLNIGLVLCEREGECSYACVSCTWAARNKFIFRSEPEAGVTLTSATCRTHRYFICKVRPSSIRFLWLRLQAACEIIWQLPLRCNVSEWTWTSKREHEKQWKQRLTSISHISCNIHLDTYSKSHWPRCDEVTASLTSLPASCVIVLFIILSQGSYIHSFTWFDYVCDRMASSFSLASLIKLHLSHYSFLHFLINTLSVVRCVAEEETRKLFHRKDSSDTSRAIERPSLLVSRTSTSLEHFCVSSHLALFTRGEETKNEATESDTFVRLMSNKLDQVSERCVIHSLAIIFSLRSCVCAQNNRRQLTTDASWCHIKRSGEWKL